jgi:hypothetical protein
MSECDAGELSAEARSHVDADCKLGGQNVEAKAVIDFLGGWKVRTNCVGQ